MAVQKTMTINQTLSLIKQVDVRIADLRNLRNQTSTKELWRSHGEQEREITPTYDMKELDKKITELQNWKWKAEYLIKESNAKTDIEINADPEQLLAHLI
jgi:hypothetical protein